MILPNGKKGMDYSIQVGDMGIGFHDHGDLSFHNAMSENHKFIHGNHDNPAYCKTSPNFLGRYGYNKSSGIFYVSGGFSIDRIYRTVDVNFWENEEVNYTEQEEIIKLYKKIKPRIVSTHDTPTVFRNSVITNPDKFNDCSISVAMFDEMFKIHQPEYWICGHHHVYKKMQIDNTTFVTLADVCCFNTKFDDDDYEKTYNEINNYPCIYCIDDVSW